MFRLTHIINIRSGRAIAVNGKIWNTLSDEEKRDGQIIMEAKITYEDCKRKIMEKRPCTICTNEVLVKVNTTLCCKQILCLECFIKSNNFSCPYCRTGTPYVLSERDINRKRLYNNEEEKEPSTIVFEE
jgi:hypothetical protein